MRTPIEFVVGISVALAILVVLIYPLTIGPPAPQQKLFGVLSLLFAALSAISLQIAATARSACLWQSYVVAPNTTSERLALTCARLC